MASPRSPSTMSATPPPPSLVHTPSSSEINRKGGRPSLLSILSSRPLSPRSSTSGLPSIPLLMTDDSSRGKSSSSMDPALSRSSSSSSSNLQRMMTMLNVNNPRTMVWRCLMLCMAMTMTSWHGWSNHRFYSYNQERNHHEDRVPLVPLPLITKSSSEIDSVNKKESFLKAGPLGVTAKGFISSETSLVNVTSVIPNKGSHSEFISRRTLTSGSSSSSSTNEFGEEEANSSSLESSSSALDVPMSTLPLRSSCLAMNSEDWLSKPRYSNFHDSSWWVNDILWLRPNVSLLAMIDGEQQQQREYVQPPLQQTLCHAQSPLLNVSDDTHEDPRSIRLWATRLTYLAMYHHQHRHALPEAQLRWAASSSSSLSVAKECRDELEQHHVGPLDYECPEAKYLVILMGGNGLGANIRGGTVVALMLGLITDRVVLFVNHANVTNDRPMQQPWALASCPRADFQCVFMPSSPCSVSLYDLDEAYTLPNSEARSWLRTGTGPTDHQNVRVWKFHQTFSPWLGQSLPASKRLAHYARELLQGLPTSDPRWPAMQLAIQAIEMDHGIRPGYNYTTATLRIQHVLAVYSMRPNPVSAQKINNMMKVIIPANFVPEAAIGLPIRASDKCKKESECLTFHQYMQITNDWWSHHHNQSSGKAVATTPLNPTVVFTTEARSVVLEQQAFAQDTEAQAKLSYNFSFLMNSLDITPDTGLLDRRIVDADEAMISSLASFKFQLLPAISIGNCCSNFHSVLSDFLAEGCGAARDNQFHCLQENKDPALKVCCGWQHSCIKSKKAYLAALQSDLAHLEKQV